MSKVSAILTADWHFRDDQPVCRLDNFMETQIRKLQWICGIWKKYDCPLICAGDVFDYWKSSPFLISQLLTLLPTDRQVFAVWGNHDLPQHSLELQQKSALYTLVKAERVKILPGVHWGQVPDVNSGMEIDGKKVLVWHVGVFDSPPAWTGDADFSAIDILNTHTEYDLIVTGHYHTPLVKKLGNRLLVNPGSISRQTADQIESTPRVYLWYAETNSVEELIIPHRKGVISREHLEKKEEQLARYQAFITHLKSDKGVGLSFRQNLEQFFRINKTEKAVQELIYWAIEKSDKEE